MAKNNENVVDEVVADVAVEPEVTIREEVKEPKKEKKANGNIKTVTGGDLNVRDSANGELLFTIPDGSKVVVEQNGEWAKITGFVKGEYLA